jgi:hypothetical protein
METRATFRLSLPSPFHAMKSRPAPAQRLGACGLVSGEVYFPPKVTPLFLELSTFRLSFPSPFQPRKSLPLIDAIVGLAGLVSGSVTLFAKPVIVFPDRITCATFR